MEEQIIFEYPVLNEREQIIDTYRSYSYGNTKLRIISIILAFLGLVCLPFIALTNGNLQFVLIILFIGLLLSSLLVARTVKGVASHFTMITAFESYMKLDIYSNRNKFLREITLRYCDILSCSFSKDYDKAFIFYSYNDISNENITGKDGEKTENNASGQVTIYITPGSFEQYFFLYIAPQLFKVTAEEWKIVKKFGNEREYLMKNGLDF